MESNQRDRSGHDAKAPHSVVWTSFKFKTTTKDKMTRHANSVCQTISARGSTWEKKTKANIQFLSSIVAPSLTGTYWH